MEITGLVLCGGASRRMGSDKAGLEVLGRSQLAHVVRALRSAGCPAVHALAGAGQSLPEDHGCDRILRDAETRPLGPVHALATGLRELALPPNSRIFAAAVDLPYLRPGHIRHLATLLRDPAWAVVPWDAHPHPLCALYRVGEMRSRLQALLGERAAVGQGGAQLQSKIRLRDLVRGPGVCRIDPRDLPEPRVVEPCNDPEAFARAVRGLTSLDEPER